MKKTLTICLSVLLCAAVTPLLSHTHTAQDVLDKMIEVQGGRQALESIADMTLSGNMDMIQMGLSGSMTMYFKEPNMMRMDIEIMGMVITQAFDGEKAWMVNPQTGIAEELPDSMSRDFKRQAMGNDALLNPDKYGISYTLKDNETIDGRDYFVLEQAFSDGHSARLYIDSETFLVHKSASKTTNEMGMEVEGETMFSDYREVDGTKVAFAMTIMQDGSEFGRMTVAQVEYNKGLEDSFFHMK